MNFILDKIRGYVMVLVMCICSLPALGQGCAMCRANAKSTPKEGQQAINRAILVMMVPLVGFMVVGVGLAFRYGKKRDQDQD